MKPKVLFIKPYFQDITVMPHLGIGYLMAMLRKSGIESAFIDNCLMKYNDNKLANKIRDFAPDIVGISSSTPMIKSALDIARLAKRLNKDTKIVFGGCHPSAAVEETLQDKNVDCIAIGEAELVITDLVAALYLGEGLGDIPGIAYEKDGEIIIEKKTSMLNRDLDSLPLPAFELMGIEDYFSRGTKMGMYQKSLRCIPLMASRGCPSNCTFCQRYLGNIYRKRSPESIVDEIRFWKSRYGVSEFNFVDDNFTFHKKNAMITFEEILKKDLHVTIRFPNGVREDFLDDELLEVLRRVGCSSLEFGFESGCQKTLDVMKKGKKVETMAQKALLSKKHGFTIGSNFLFGTPGENLEDMEETIGFALRLPLDKAGFGLIIPFPGTEIREEAIQKGYLIHSDYEKYNPIIEYCRPALQTPDWTGEEVMEKVLEARKRYYLRPKYIFNNAFDVLTSGNMSLYARMMLGLMSRREK